MADQSLAERIFRAAGVAGVAFGAVATLTPRGFGAVYGLGSDPTVRVLTRLWGTRTAWVGAIALGVGNPQDHRTLMTVAAAMNSADAVLIASGGPGLSMRARVLGSLTPATFAAALAYGLANGD